MRNGNGVRLLFSNQVEAPEDGRPALKLGQGQEQAVEVQSRDRMRRPASPSLQDVSQRWARRGA